MKIWIHTGFIFYVGKSNAAACEVINAKMGKSTEGKR